MNLKIAGPFSYKDMRKKDPNSWKQRYKAHISISISLSISMSISISISIPKQPRDQVWAAPAWVRSWAMLSPGESGRVA